MNIFLILTIPLLIAVLNAYGLEEYYSSEQALKESDVSVVGKITSLEKISEEGKTEYVINVEEFMKLIPPMVQPGVNLTAVAEGRFYEVGDRGLFFLNFLDDHKNGTDDILKSKYKISELSKTTKSNCSGTVLLGSTFVADEFILSQNGKNQNLHTKFPTNQPLNITFDAYNRNLTSQTMDFQFKVLTQQGPILSEQQQIRFEECKKSAQTTWIFTPTFPGSYAIQALMGGKEVYTLSGLVVEDYVAPALKQFKSGIAAEDVKCKQSFQLVIKARDGSPICVKPQTKAKLIQRGWALDNQNNSDKIDSKKSDRIDEQTSDRDKDVASVQGKSGRLRPLIETVPASSGTVVNFYITDDDLNTSPKGVDVIQTKGLLEFTINGIPIDGPSTMTETGLDTGKFFVRLDLPDSINGRPLKLDDILEIKYLDKTDVAGEKRITAQSVSLTETFARVQTSGAGQTRIGHEFVVRIYEPDMNLDSKDVDTIPLSRLEYRGEGGIKTTLANHIFDANSSFLLETGPNTGIFEVVIKIPRTIDGKTVHIGNWYEIRYIDTSTPSDTSEEIKLKGRIG